MPSPAQLTRRVAALVAARNPSPAADGGADDRELFTEAERWERLCYALRGWPGGGPSPAVVWDSEAAGWRAQHFDAGPLAELLNRVQRRAQIGPILPALPGELAGGLALLDDGRWLGVQSDDAAGFLHIYGAWQDREARDSGAAVRDALLVWRAQTGEPLPRDLAELRALLARLASMEAANSVFEY